MKYYFITKMEKMYHMIATQEAKFTLQRSGKNVFLIAFFLCTMYIDIRRFDPQQNKTFSRFINE